MRFFFVVPMIGMLACGSTDVSEVLGSGASNDGGGASDGGVADDAAVSGDGATEGGTKCDRLQTAVNKARAQIVKCSLSSGAIQCSKLLADVCCKVIVTSTEGSDVRTFIAAVEAFNKAGCSAPCPDTRCADSPTNLCSGLGSVGTCAQQ